MYRACVPACMQGLSVNVQDAEAHSRPSGGVACTPLSPASMLSAESNTRAPFQHPSVLIFKAQGGLIVHLPFAEPFQFL